MVYANQKKEAKQVNFLKSEKFVSFTAQVDNTHAGVVNGVLPAGSIIPANDNTARGITLHDVDVTKGKQPVGMLVEGHILTERLPVAPDNQAKKALKNITFYAADGSYTKG